MNRASPDGGKRARACEASNRHHASEHDRNPDAAAQCERVVRQRLVQLLAPVRCYRIRGGTGGLTWIDDGSALIEYLGL
jgi:hypothetical protein